MVIVDRYPTFKSISQRAANTYLRSLAKLEYSLPTNGGSAQQDEMIRAQGDLHAFFKEMYTRLLGTPELFGLPLDEDASIEGGEAEMTELKQKLNAKLKKPRECIAQGLDMLMLLGKDGALHADALALDTKYYAASPMNTKKGKKFMEGLRGMGLDISEEGGLVVFRNPTFPAMMPALKALAEACSQYVDEKLGKFNFARCDFRALAVNYHPTPVELYRGFNPVDFERAERLHDFLSHMGYKPVYQIYGSHGWEVQYQGKRKIKASPLVRIEYSERHRNPMVVNIKCASAERLIPLIYQRSEALQRDFTNRTYPCRGDECGWCNSKTNLGPSVLEMNGEKRSICWYTNPDFREFNDSSVELIQEYAIMHEQLE